ncbi:MAG: type II toxin-antitoxin system RelE/ParE family toxin [Armatimonadetes bacterium]|nr:type II toxin-antitoxin system RelE/ParE family toxin [Armatimonadota bacterium]
MKYRVEVSPGAARDLKKLPAQVLPGVIKAVKELAQDPRPSGAKKLEGIPDCYRVRRGVYRIVYTIEDNVLKIDVVTVGHRKEVYKGLQNKVRRRVQ